MSIKTKLVLPPAPSQIFIGAQPAPVSLADQEAGPEPLIAAFKASQFGIFGSDRSPRNANLRLFVRSVKTCLEHTIFIFWPQILQDDLRMTS